jgi:flagellar motor switch/type III secretory pathway protein FliN
MQKLIEEYKNKLIDQVKNLNIYDLMLLNIIDDADWLVTEFTKMCREDVEKKNPRTLEEYQFLLNQCLYETKPEVKKLLEMSIGSIIQSAEELFEIFFNYQLTDLISANEEFHRKINEIKREALKMYYPYDKPPEPIKLPVTK